MGEYREHVLISGDARPYERALDQATAKTKASAATWTASLQKAGTSLSTFGRSATKYVTLPIVAAGVAMVKLASDAGEVENKVREVFQGMAGDVIAWSDSSIDKMGLAKATAQDMAATFGLLFQAAGLPGPEVIGLSKDFTQLAADMASFFNLPIEEALMVLRAGLVGETEPLRRFGVLLSEANVQAEAMRLGLVATGQALTEQDKVIARSSFIMSALSTASGDYARTADSVANKTRATVERMKELGAEIGQDLMPIAEQFLQTAGGILGFINDLSPGTRQAAIQIAGLAAVIGPLALVAARAAKAIAVLYTTITAHPIVAAVAALTALLLALKELTSSDPGADLLADLNTQLDAGTITLREYATTIKALDEASSGLILVTNDFAETEARLKEELYAGTITAQEYLQALQVLGEVKSQTAEETAREFQAQLKAREETERAILAVAGLATAQREGAGWAHVLAGRVRDVGEALDDGTAAAEQFKTALDKLAGAALGVEKSSLAWLGSLADLREELKQGTKTLDDSTEAGRENRYSILAAVDAALQHAEAIAEKTGNEDEAIRVAQSHIREILETARASGIAEGDIRDYIKQLKLTPKQIRTLLQLEGVDQATNELDRFFRRFDGRVINTRLGITTPSEIDGSGRVVVEEASGAIIRAQRGLIARRPALLVGEGRSPTRWGPGAEAVIPFDARGIAILAEVFETALRRITPTGVESGHTMIVERPVLLDRRRFLRQQDYEPLSRGW